MKPASQALIDYLANTRQVVFMDTFTFIFADGSKAFYTNGQLQFTGVRPFQTIADTFVANDVMISGMKFKLGIGVEVDEQEVKVTYSKNSTVQGLPWRVALMTGQFDGCQVQRDRFFFEKAWLPPVGSLPLFYGQISSLDNVGRTEATVKVKSSLVLLNMMMPRVLAQPSCIHTLYDTGCGLAKASFAVNDTITASPHAPTRSFIPFASSSSKFTLGTIAVTISSSIVQTRTVKYADTTGCYLTQPLDYTPVAGMQISVWPGCDKTMATCANATFNNLPKFKGFPYVPPPETAF